MSSGEKQNFKFGYTEMMDLMAYRREYPFDTSRRTGTQQRAPFLCRYARQSTVIIFVSERNREFVKLNEKTTVSEDLWLRTLYMHGHDLY